MDGPEFTAGGWRLTRHAARRLTERSIDVDGVIEKYSHRFEQNDGAIVFVRRQGSNRYDVVIVDDEAIVTLLAAVSKRELQNLARNYGWR